MPKFREEEYQRPVLEVCFSKPYKAFSALPCRSEELDLKRGLGGRYRPKHNKIPPWCKNDSEASDADSTGAVTYVITVALGKV